MALASLKGEAEASLPDSVKYANKEMSDTNKK